jgi:hypothetical protein
MVVAAGPGTAAGAAVVASAGVPRALVLDLDTTGALFGFVARVPDSGAGAITSISGNSICGDADAIGGTKHNPTAIAEPTVEERPPHRQIFPRLIRSP